MIIKDLFYTPQILTQCSAILGIWELRVKGNKNFQESRLDISLFSAQLLFYVFFFMKNRKLKIGKMLESSLRIN